MKTYRAIDPTNPGAGFQQAVVLTVGADGKSCSVRLMSSGLVFCTRLDALQEKENRPLSAATRKASAKRWAKANGYHGAQGGWIYNSRTNLPVVQGWLEFFSTMERRIQADIEADKFTLSVCKD